MKNCPYAYRKSGDVSVHCRVLTEDKNSSQDYCAHQYLCNMSRRWEVSTKGQTCTVKNKRRP